MVLPIATIIPICLGILTSFVTINHYTKPRLPVYIMTPILSTLPRLRYVVDEWKTEVAMKISFYNENYVHLDIYALTFDLLVVDTPTGLIRHLGTITDQQQSTLSIQQHENNEHNLLAASSSSSSNDGTTKGVILSTTKKNNNNNNNRVHPNIIWSVDGRTNFTSQTKLHIAVSTWDIIQAIPSLLHRWYYNYGVTLPTTGAVHVKAKTNKKSAAIPVTISIMCDNILNTWTLQVQGVHCILHTVNPGWSNLTKTAVGVRNHAVTKLTPGNSTSGSILQSHNWETIVHNIAWDEIQQAIK